MNIGDKADLEMTNLAFAGDDQTDGWRRAAGVDQLANGGANQTNMTVTQTSSHYQVTSQQVRHPHVTSTSHVSSTCHLH